MWNGGGMFLWNILILPDCTAQIPEDHPLKRPSPTSFHYEISLHWLCFWTLSIVLFLSMTRNFSETEFCLRLRWNVFHWAQSVQLVRLSGDWICLRLQVKRTTLGQIDGARFCLCRLDSVSVFRFNLLSSAQSVKLLPVSGDWICLRLHVKRTPLGPIDRAGPYLRRLDSVSVFRWNVLHWAQSVELLPIFGVII
jgi:hypothetical protein